jgi:hypothetical protein
MTYPGSVLREIRRRSPEIALQNAEGNHRAEKDQTAVE